MVRPSAAAQAAGPLSSLSPPVATQCGDYKTLSSREYMFYIAKAEKDPYPSSIPTPWGRGLCYVAIAKAAYIVCYLPSTVPN